MVLAYRAFGHRALGIGHWARLHWTLGIGHWERENDKNTFPITDYPCPMTRVASFVGDAACATLLALPNALSPYN